MIESEFRVEPADWLVDQADLRRVRIEVFVMEQNVPVEEELDELDASSVHVVARDNSGIPIGTGRLTPHRRIGRMAVLAGWRGRQVGAAILRSLIERARELGYPSLELHAQSHAIAFYARFGFISVSDEFFECAIPHRTMRLALPPPEPAYRPVARLDATPEPRLIAVDGREQALATTLELLSLAKRELCIYTRDLDSDLFDQDSTLAEFRRLGTVGRGASVRILIQAPAAAMRAGHRLIHLAHRLTSIFQFRTPDAEEDLHYPAAFLLTDRRSYYFRALGSRYEGEAHTYAPGRHAQLQDYFNQVWERSSPSDELRQLQL